MKLNVIFILPFVLSIFLSGCTGKDQNITESEQPEKTQKVDTIADLRKRWPAAGSTSGDTLSIYGKYLVFYGPEKTAADKDEQEFIAMSERITAELSSNPQIKITYTSASFIKVYSTVTGRPMTIDRNTFSKQVGFLYTDGGQPPKLRNGYISEEDCLKLIREYFFLPS